MYPTNSVEINQFILSDCKANIVVVESEEMGLKILENEADLPYLKMIITCSSEIKSLNSKMMTWEELMEMGKEYSDDNPIVERHLRMAINECCLLIYTSGTTGNPKGKYLGVYMNNHTMNEYNC